MINKVVSSAAEGIAGIRDGATVMVGGFGEAGSPTVLIQELIESGVCDLTVVSNNAGNGDVGLGALIGSGQVRKVVCSYPRSVDSQLFASLYRTGLIELEIVPQGTLAERIRAGGAGIAAFYTPTAVGTPLATGKESRWIDDREYVLEYGLKADFALIKCEMADHKGNLTYSKTSRNFNPVMATAASITVVQARRVVEAGDIDPESVITPGIFVDRILAEPRLAAGPKSNHITVAAF